MDKALQQRSGCELIAEVTGSFGEVCLKVTGSSMMPVIWPDDVITVQREMDDLQPGQIVLYRRGETLVAHRIVCVHEGFLITRGDSLANDDPPIGEPDVVGRVTGIVRDGRCLHPSQSLWQRAGSYVLQRSHLCLCMALHFRRLWREMAWAS